MGSHVALEVQHDMAEGQYDVARSSCSLLGCFGAFGPEPRRVGGPTRHGGGPIRRGALFRLTFGLFCHLGGGATSRWRSNATSRGPNATWRTLFAPFWAVLAPWRRSHVVLEVQRDMAGTQCDVARSFYPLFGCFGAFGVEPRRVGAPTRHGGDPIRHGQALMRRGRAQYNVTRLFLGLLTQKSHLRTRSEVAGFMLIWFLVCLTCQLGH